MNKKKIFSTLYTALLLSALSSFVVNGQAISLYDGKVYNPTPKVGKTTPYYLDILSPTLGTINFDGVYYDSVFLFLNIQREVLVVRNPSTNMYTEVTSDFISDFSIGPHKFKYIRNGLPKGIYKLIFEKEGYYALAKHSKLATDVLIDRKAIREYSYSVKYFFKSPTIDSYTSSTKAKNVLALSKIRKNTAKHVKSNGLNFRDNPENAITEALNYVISND